MSDSKQLILACFDDFFAVYNVTEKDRQELLARLEALIGEPVAYLDPVDKWVLSKADYFDKSGMDDIGMNEVHDMYSIPLYRLDKCEE